MVARAHPVTPSARMDSMQQADWIAVALYTTAVMGATTLMAIFG
jgi:hypothetical protein